jgi:alanine dehydrogenase
MNIGIVRERGAFGRRVARTPPAVRRLAGAGQNVWAKSGAGDGGMYRDTDYVRAGAQLAYSPEEVIGRAELLTKIGGPTSTELHHGSPATVVMAFYHLAVDESGFGEILAARDLAAIGCEVIEEEGGRLRGAAGSEIAGQMTVPIATHRLRSSSAGSGILPGGTPGVAPARFVIPGAGTAGFAAAGTAVATGGRVLVFDRDPPKLRHVMEHIRTVETGLAGEDSIGKALAGADLFIGAILIAGTWPLHIATRQMVEQIRSRSAILAVSTDQGGCLETSRPTCVAEPTLVCHGIAHFCAPFSADLGRAASMAIAQAVLPYALTTARHGLQGALDICPALGRGAFALPGRKP